jgi:hypothetical protein
MNTLRRWLLSGWLVGVQTFLPVHAQAQEAPRRYVLSGFVTDAARGERLVGATLYVPALRTGTVTNADGFFRLVLPADSLVLHVSYLGYRPLLLPLRLQHDTELRLALTPTPVGLDEVEVVAERGEVAPRMGAVTLSVEEIRKLPALLGEVDVIKALQLLPGVQAGAEGATGLYVRGGGPDQNLILLDVTPVYNISHVLGFLSMFNAEALQQVRLVKGGFPARYGGRLSSVVDLMPKEGNLRRFEADGTVGLVFSSLTVQGPLARDRASFLLSARRTYIDVLARPFLNRRLPEGQRLAAYFYDTNARLHYAPTPHDRLFLNGYLGRDVYGSTYETTDPLRRPVYRERNTGGSDWGNRTGTLRWQHRFSNRVLSNATGFYSHYQFDVRTRLEQIEERQPPVRQSEEVLYTSGIADLGARLDVDYQPAPGHNVRLGGGATRHQFNPGVSRLRLRLADTGALDTTLTPNAFRFSGTEAFLYAEDDFPLTRRLRLNAGLHGAALQVQGTTYTSLQPRLSLHYRRSPGFEVTAAFSTMEQYLHLLTNSGLNLPTDLWLSATSRTRPQRAWQAALGTTHTLGGGAWRASLEGYYKDMRGLIEYAPGASYLSPHEDWQDKVVVGRGWSWGIEVFLQKQRGRTLGWVGYTLAWAGRQFDALNDGQPFPYRYDRRHDLKLVLTHRRSERLDLGLIWVYGTGQAITLAEARYYDGRLLDLRYFDGTLPLPELRGYGPRGGYRMAAYHRLDLSLNRHFRKALFLRRGEGTLAIGAYNVYNRKNPFYLFAVRSPDGSHRYKQASLFPVLPFVSYRFHF